MPCNRLITHPRSLVSSLQYSATWYMGFFGPILPVQTTEKYNNWCMMLPIMQLFSPLCRSQLGSTCSQHSELKSPLVCTLQTCKHILPCILCLSTSFWQWHSLLSFKGSLQIGNNCLHSQGQTYISKYTDSSIIKFCFLNSITSILTGGQSGMK